MPNYGADDDIDADGAASLGASSSPAPPPVLITTVDIGEGRSDRIELRVGDDPTVRFLLNFPQHAQMFGRVFALTRDGAAETSTPECSWSGRADATRSLDAYAGQHRKFRLCRHAKRQRRCWRQQTRLSDRIRDSRPHAPASLIYKRTRLL